MRILRAAFFLSVIAILAPSPPESEVEQVLAKAKEAPSNYELLSAAGKTMSDLRQFCLRQPAVCETASYVAARVEAKAKYSVRKLYEWASDTGSGGIAAVPQSDQAEADQLMTGSTVQLADTDGITISRSTLTPEDMLPVWRKAQNQKKL